MALKFGKRSAVNLHAEYKPRLVYFLRPEINQFHPYAFFSKVQSMGLWDRFITQILFADRIMSSILTDILLLCFDLRKSFFMLSLINLIV